MLCNLAGFHTEQVVERHVFSSKLAFTHLEHKVAFAQNFVVLGVFHGHASFGHGLQGGDQT